MRLLWGAIFIFWTMVKAEYDNKKFFVDIVSVFLTAWVWESFAFYFSFRYGAIFKVLGVFLGSACLIKILLKLYKRYNTINKPIGEYTKTTEVDLKTIKNLYQVSKGRFELPRYYNYNLSYDCCFFNTDPGTNRWGVRKVQLTFPNFFGYLKFYAWDYMENRRYAKGKSVKQKAEKAERNKKNLEIVIAQAQADIDVLKERANAEIERANEMMAEVKENMKKA